MMRLKLPVYDQNQSTGLHGKWFEKANERGAKPNDQDAEIRSILNKKSEKECAAIVAHLLAKDTYRFEWVKSYKPSSAGSRLAITHCRSNFANVMRELKLCFSIWHDKYEARILEQAGVRFSRS